jgi:hypothetical protein
MVNTTTAALPSGAFMIGDEIVGNQSGVTKRLTLNSSALSDYETGSWTPYLFGGTVSGDTTYSVQYGHYIRIGGLLYGVVDLDWSTTTASGTAFIGGLPFTSKSYLGNIRHAVTFSGYGDFAITATDERISGSIAEGVSDILLLGNKINTASVLTIAEMANDGYLRGSFTYTI